MIGVKILNWKKISFFTSCTIIVTSLVIIGLTGFAKGVEFSGGTLIEIKLTKNIDLEVFNDNLNKHIKEIDKNMSGSSQLIGDSVLSIRFSTSSANNKVSSIKNAILEVLGDENATFEKIDDIGPQISGELLRQSIIAIAFAFVAIAVYMSVRFNKHFAISGVLVLLQDVIITLGFVSFYKIEFDLTLMAAFLTIIGYCINDTVVIYDRIRYNLMSKPGSSVIVATETGIQQTIKRSVITSFVTLLAVFGILFFSNQSIQHFGITVGFGIIVGTIGSIFVASVLPVSIGLKPYIMPTKIKRDPLFYTI